MPPAPGSGAPAARNRPACAENGRTGDEKKPVKVSATKRLTCPKDRKYKGNTKLTPCGSLTKCGPNHIVSTPACAGNSSAACCSPNPLLNCLLYMWRRLPSQKAGWVAGYPFLLVSLDLKGIKLSAAFSRCPALFKSSCTVGKGRQAEGILEFALSFLRPKPVGLRVGEPENPAWYGKIPEFD